MNIVVQLIFDVAIVYFWGWSALAYLGFSFLFSVGLHPLGARWIQEHFLVLDKKQETFSYYGGLNSINMNVGFHNEHHDMPSISWNNLPKLKNIAPRNNRKPPLREIKNSNQPVAFPVGLRSLAASVEPLAFPPNRANRSSEISSHETDCRQELCIFRRTKA
jgi:fatty acid desaturase